MDLSVKRDLRSSLQRGSALGALALLAAIVFGLI